jgi:hypothetical protein
MGERKIRSNKGKSRGPYKPRQTDAITKCVKALETGLLLYTKTGTPYLKTKAGNRYSCKAELKRKGLSQRKTGDKPTNAASKYKKGTVRNGYYVKVVKKPGSSGHMKVWRKL